MYIGLPCKVPVFPPNLMQFPISRQIFEKNTQISNFTKIRSVGAELLHENGKTDRRYEACRNFANAPKEGC